MKGNSFGLPSKPNLLVKGHIGPIYTVKFNSGGEYCMTGSEDRNVCLYNPSKNLLIKTYKAIHNYAVHSLAISNDNSKFVTGGGDKLVFLTDVSEGKAIRKYQGHAAAVNCVAYNTENNVIVNRHMIQISGSYDTTVRFWDNRTGGYAPIDIIRGMRDSVSHILVHRLQIIVSSIDGFLRTYDIRKGEVSEDNFRQPIHKFALSNDLKMLAVSCTNNHIYLQEKGTGSKLKDYHGHTAQDFTIDVGFNVRDSHILSGSEDGSLYIYNLLNSEFEQRLNCHSKALSALDIYEGGSVVSGSHDGTLAYWKV